MHKQKSQTVLFQKKNANACMNKKRLTVRQQQKIETRAPEILLTRWLMRCAAFFTTKSSSIVPRLEYTENWIYIKNKWFCTIVWPQGCQNIELQIEFCNILQPWRSRQSPLIQKTSNTKIIISKIELSSGRITICFYYYVRHDEILKNIIFVVFNYSYRF